VFLADVVCLIGCERKGSEPRSPKNGERDDGLTAFSRGDVEHLESDSRCRATSGSTIQARLSPQPSHQLV